MGCRVSRVQGVELRGGVDDAFTGFASIVLFIGFCRVLYGAFGECKGSVKGSPRLLYEGFLRRGQGFFHLALFRGPSIFPFRV